MSRTIDGDELLRIERLLDTDEIRKSKTASWLLDQVLHDIQAQPTIPPRNKWVSVEEKLPERYENVIVHYKNGKIEFDWQDGQGNFLLDGEYGRVTHWMPIPAPPDCRPPERNGGSQR